MLEIIIFQHCKHISTDFNDNTLILGGNVGLFTGMSILSMFELIFWIARFVSGIVNGSV